MSTNFSKNLPADNNDASHGVLCGTKKLNKSFFTAYCFNVTTNDRTKPASAQTSSISARSLISIKWYIYSMLYIFYGIRHIKYVK